MFLTTIYKDDEIYTYVGNVTWTTTTLNVRDYDDVMKKTLQNRLCFHMSDSTIVELKDKNSRFKRIWIYYCY